MTAPLPTLLNALLARAHRGMELGLEATRAALSTLGDPHLGLAVVHVAGTNGKGSVCAMVEAIARAGGLRTGLYTSPHLCRFAERIQIDGRPISDAAFARSLERALATEETTFFETLTVAAFDAFHDAGVEQVVLEVGLGGRLDATNVVPAPLCTAITSIALDHQAMLGSTLTEIAREKAGIAKPGVPLVLGYLGDEPARAVREVATAAGARLLLAPPLPEGLAVSLAGPHQRANAGVAAAIADVLAPRWPQIAAAIALGLATTRWPGRLEMLEVEGVRVVLDCAHNQQAADALAHAVATPAWRSEDATLLFGALADKPYREMLARLAPLALRRIYTSPSGRSPAPLAELAQVAAGEEIADPRAALARALSTAGRGPLLITGSSYLVGELRGALRGETCDPMVAL